MVLRRPYEKCVFDNNDPVYMCLVCINAYYKVNFIDFPFLL